MKKSELRKLIREVIIEEAQLLNELYTMNCGGGWCECHCDDGGSTGFAATGDGGGGSSGDMANCRDFCRHDTIPTKPEKGDYVDYLPPDPSDIRRRKRFN